jgi:hypothetical protein
MTAAFLAWTFGGCAAMVAAPLAVDVPVAPGLAVWFAWAVGVFLLRSLVVRRWRMTRLEGCNE